MHKELELKWHSSHLVQSPLSLLHEVPDFLLDTASSF